MKLRPALAAPLAFLVASSLAAPALAEPTEPVVIGWWSYFDNTKVDTTTSAAHQVTSFGDPDTYYYEPSGGKGLQEDPNVLPPDQAWQNMVSYILAKSNNASLSASFGIDTNSDLSQFTQAYYGYALVLLYVPKDKYCDGYRIHIGSVDDGVQAMANATILGYDNLGEQNKYIDMVEYNSNPPKLVLRPGINEVVLIHEDQAAVQRYVHDVWIEHNGAQIPLAPKNIAWGRAFDSMTMKPIYEAKIGISGNGVNDSFVTGPFGFYFFDGLFDGSYALTADAAGYKTGAGNVAVALGQGVTEVVRTDFPLEEGCTCPEGKMCGPSGGCLDPCKPHGEFGEICDDPAATCVNHVCVTNPCDTLTCKPGFLCEEGMAGNPPVAVGNCVEQACSNVCCGPGQICSAGACVADNCGAGCPNGQACAGGNCVDACSVLTCVAPLVCVAGVCEDPCKADPASCGGAGGGFGVGGGGGFFPGTGGAGGGGGSSGTGGATGTSGTTSSSGGASGSSGGCGCRAGGDDPEAAGALALTLAGLLISRRRRAA
ncbi:MAG: carboxypeptidase-like regulatory domain-containing protein [Byssovorax sp.]